MALQGRSHSECGDTDKKSAARITRRDVPQTQRWVPPGKLLVAYWRWASFTALTPRAVPPAVRSEHPLARSCSVHPIQPEYGSYGPRINDHINGRCWQIKFPDWRRSDLGFNRGSVGSDIHTDVHLSL